MRTAASTLASLTVSLAGAASAPAQDEGIARGLTWSTPSLLMQEGNPAVKAGDDSPRFNEGHLRSFELPGVKVEGGSSLREEELVGSYKQPRWTATRRFPSTRVYVIPAGKIEVEYWARPTFTRDDKTENRMLGELEVGLGHRFQLDVYFRTDQEDIGSHAEYGAQFEMRYALADWGEIWGNPTFYFEYINLENRPDKIEPKLLLGGEIPSWGEGWHWGLNFVAELEISGREREHEYEFTSGLSKTIVDEKFSVGGEFKFSLVDVNDDRGHFDTPFLLGPTFQYRPVEPMTINLETLVGLGGESPYGQITLNVGWEF